MSYDLLSEPIRRYIRDQRWDALRPIQAAAITRILTTEDHYILASRTASGKTEAAFLPILSKVDFTRPGVQVLYISPLIALINGQFTRVEDLCKHLDVTVTKWHGEASRAAKEKLLKSPNGVVLITPESIEAMLANHPAKAKVLFRNLQFVVIDEIHSFLGTDRGLHLQSLLHRVRQLNPENPARIVGLSATIGDYEAAKRFTGEPQQTKVLLDKTSREIDAQFRFVETEGPTDIRFQEALYEATRHHKALIFPNARGRVESIAVGLKKIAARRGGHEFYFSHHSSVDRELREHVETFAKSNKHQPFCIVCTSTLELGIDIGSVDVVVQVDAAPSVASLIQRVGRSGRRAGEKSALLFYTDKDWDLLQAYACWELYGAGFIEPVGQEGYQPFDILFHQVLSILKETSGLSRQHLLARLAANPAFAAIEAGAQEAFLEYLIEAEFVEDLRRELIVGVEGEKLTSSREFYTVFSTPEMFQVFHSGKQIGQLPFSEVIQVDENVLLAAAIWKIRDVDFKAKRILVVRAADGKPPLFGGDGGNIHAQVRQQMLELLYSVHVPEYLNAPAVAAITELRSLFKNIPLTDFARQRPCVVKENSLLLYTFTSSKIDATLLFLLRCLGIEAKEGATGMEVLSGKTGPMELVENLLRATGQFEDNLSAAFDETPECFPVSKWGAYLPDHLKKMQVLEQRYDIEGTKSFLERVVFVAE